MNNTFTEHVNKKDIQLASDVKKSFDFHILLIFFVACAGFSIVLFSRESFICQNSGMSTIIKPRQILASEGYALRVLDKHSSIYEGPKTDQTLLVDVVKPTIEVVGNRETHERLTFAMSDFSEDLTYMIDFGNGTSQLLSQQSLPHVYQQPGTYKVTVKGMKEGVTKVLSTKFLMIADAIETPDLIAEVEI